MAAESVALGVMDTPAKKNIRSVEELRKIYNLHTIRPPRGKKAPKKREEDYTLKEKIYCLLDPSQPTPNNTYRKASIGTALSIFMLIFISIVVFVLQSVPEYEYPEVFPRIESVCVMFFTVEVVLKLATCPTLRTFIGDLYNWIDVISILPYYVDLFVENVLGKHNNVNLLFLRVIRLARVFRMFKLGKYNRPFGMVLLVVINSIDALFLLVFLLFMSVILFSSLMWMSEQTNSTFDRVDRQWVRNDGTISPFQSIPHAFWWCMCTLTTVGYGDEVPTSTVGKVVAGASIVIGVFVMAFPVILISYNYSEMAQKQVLRELYRGGLSKKRRHEEPAVGGGGLLLGGMTERHRQETLPELGTRVASWRCGGRVIGLYFNGALGHCPSFYYDPHLSITHLPESQQAWEEGRPLYYSMLLALGGAEGTLRAVRMLQHIHPFSQMTVCPEFVSVRRIVRLQISIPQLPEGMHLLTTEWDNPGDVLQITVAAVNPVMMGMFKKRLNEMTLQCTLLYRSTALGTYRMKDPSGGAAGRNRASSLLSLRSKGRMGSSGTLSLDGGVRGVKVRPLKSPRAKRRPSRMKPAFEMDNNDLSQSVSEIRACSLSTQVVGYFDPQGFYHLSASATVPLGVPDPPCSAPSSPRSPRSPRLRTVLRQQRVLRSLGNVMAV